MWRADWLSGSGDVDELVDACPVCLKSWVWSPAWHKQGLVACICNPSIGDWVQKDQKFKVMLGRTEWDHLEVHEILFKGRKGRVMYKETHWCCKPCLTNEDSNDKRVCECVDVGWKTTRLSFLGSCPCCFLRQALSLTKQVSLAGQRTSRIGLSPLYGDRQMPLYWTIF